MEKKSFSSEESKNEVKLTYQSLFTRFSTRLEQISTELGEVSNLEKNKVIGEKVVNSARESFPDELEQLSIVVNNINNELETAEFIKEIATRTSEILASKYSLSEIENRFLVGAAEHRGFQVINELLTYELEPATVKLHISHSFTKSPVEIRGLLIDGFKKLAQEINTEDFKDIDKITGTSWIVYSSPKLVQIMGFKITNVDESKKIATATIDKDTFIKLYGETE